MKDRLILMAIVVLAGLVLSVFAAVAAGDGGPLTVDDVIAMEQAQEFDISPDGEWVVWVRRVPNEEKNERRGDVYLTRADGSATVQLTRGAHDDRAPRFSPDGRRVAFRSARGEKAKPQLYVLDLRGGEPVAVTSAQSGVRDFDWLDDGTLVFSAREDSTWREQRLRERKDDTIVVADPDHYPPVRLFTCDIAAKKSRRLTENDGVVLEFAVSPDRRLIVTGENQDVDYEYNYGHPPRQFLTEVDGGARREICARPHMTPYGFQWDASGDGFYCLRDAASDSTDTFVAIETLWYFDLAADSLRPVDLGWPRGVGRGFKVTGGGLLVSLADGIADRIAHLTPSGDGHDRRFVDTPRPVRLQAGTYRNARVVYTASDASTPPRIMTAVVDDGGFEDARRLVEINGHLEGRTLAKTAIVQWAGARGDTVEGILYYPTSYTPEDTVPRPLIGLIHGGPGGVDPDFFTERWSNYPHVIAGHGAFALKVNYHGSGNYGLEWLESIRGHYYELEVPDILAGIDYLVATGLAAPDSLGIMGWSNGSILAIQCSLESDRFKALCAGAGDVNWSSDYGNCRFGSAFDDAYFGGPPWELPDVYVDKSPLFRLDEVETPTLIAFGTEDTSVPTEQGWQHFRALQTIGKAPVRFLLFPGEEHGLQKLSHQRRKMEEELAWFDRHLFGRAAAPDPVMSESSPLALALEKTKAARVGHLYGEEHDAALVPEVVEYRGVTVGRFEVTRAQFAAFDPNYAYPPDTDNHPVTEVSLPLAQAYCLWLSEKTGRTCRLPTAAEMDTLVAAARRAGTPGNTIEHWLGRTPTPDEYAAVSAIIDSLSATRSLVEPVGSFAPAGPNGVYDLLGNAAEWATDSGEGVIRGSAAVTSAVNPRRPPMAYVGFRVIRE